MDFFQTLLGFHRNIAVKFYFRIFSVTVENFWMKISCKNPLLDYEITD